MSQKSISPSPKLISPSPKLISLSPKASQLEINEIIAEKEKQLIELSQKSKSPSPETKSPSPKLISLSPKASQPEIITEKEKQLTELSQKSKSPSPKSKSPISESKSSNFKSKLAKPESPNSIKVTYTADNMNDMNMNDIKTIAKNLHITLSKQFNGQQKSKTKQELINEILSK